ncbi:DNA-processing protein DprA [Aquifex pyrophilus]
MKLLKYLRLKDTRGVGETTIKKIINAFGSIENIEESQLEKLLGRVKAERILLSLSSERRYEENLLKSLEKGLRFITIEDKDYPELLREIKDPPPVIFYTGAKPFIGVGIVGTRKPSEISLRFVEKVVKEEGKPVISGGARGIDMKAHESALNLGIPTTVVLGYGMLKRERRIEKLLDRGRVSLVSEFLPWEEGSKYTFPKRNRIIAGLSERLYVAEAGRRSGALITAEYAYKYGREILVFVGDERSERWEGCLELVREGKAHIYDDVRKEKILDFLKVPRTFDEIKEFLERDVKSVSSLIAKLIINGKVVQEGAYYRAI